MSTTYYQDLIRRRYSVRRYQDRPIAAQTQSDLYARLETIQRGPLGTPLRLQLVAAAEGDSQALRGLGTYGFIRNPAGFILGAVQSGAHAMEDFGYAMELAVLEATALGLGTCWLGGTYARSSFAIRFKPLKGEVMPAAVAAGYAEADSRTNDPLRGLTRAENRRLWPDMFFEGGFDQSLPRSAAGEYAWALEMLRLAPSASNKQPWRVVHEAGVWHFYCQRTPGYGKGTLLFSALGLADLQRLDIGIAMCHFELTARERGLGGAWADADPGLALPDPLTFYVASWVEN